MHGGLVEFCFPVVGAELGPGRFQFINLRQGIGDLRQARPDSGQFIDQLPRLVANRHPIVWSGSSFGLPELIEDLVGAAIGAFRRFHLLDLGDPLLDLGLVLPDLGGQFLDLGLVPVGLGDPFLDLGLVLGLKCQLDQPELRRKVVGIKLATSSQSFLA